MKKFEEPKMNVMKITSDDVFTESPQCAVAALGCTSCYCVAVDCDEGYNLVCVECYANTDWDV